MHALFLRSAVAPVGALALVLLLLPATATAQAPPCPEGRPGAALELEERAFALASDRSSWETGAALLEAAAVLRGTCDPGSAEDLVSAARFYEQAGEPLRAFETMVEAGRRAADLDLLSTAAHAYVDAAQIAEGLADTARATEAVREAYLLTRRPELTGEDRRSVLRRLHLLPPDEAPEGSPDGAPALAEVKPGS